VRQILIKHQSRVVFLWTDYSTPTYFRYYIIFIQYAVATVMHAWIITYDICHYSITKWSAILSWHYFCTWWYLLLANLIAVIADAWLPQLVISLLIVQLEIFKDSHNACRMPTALMPAFWVNVLLADIAWTEAASFHAQVWLMSVPNQNKLHSYVNGVNI